MLCRVAVWESLDMPSPLIGCHEVAQETGSKFVLPDSRDFKIGHHDRLGRLDRCHVTQNKRDLSPSSFLDGMFSPGFSS